MKKFIILLFLLMPFIFTNDVFAASKITPTPTPKATPKPSDDSENQIDELKSKIASRVAQLKLVEKRGVMGKVTDVSGNEITLLDPSGQTKYVTVDELTKFNSPDNKSFGISDVKKGSSISAIGLYNKQSKRILARSLSEIEIPIFLLGIAAGIDSDDNNFKLYTQNEKPVIDVETSTKTLSYNQETGFEKSGFSKITEQILVFTYGYWDSKNKNHIIASRLILLPSLKNDPKINVPADAIKPEATNVPSPTTTRKTAPAR